jgi:hypothetical protein
LDAKDLLSLDISSIPGYLNGFPDPDLDEHIVSFHVHVDSTTLLIASFMRIISDFDVVHEDVMIKMFVFSLEYLQKYGLKVFVKRKYIHLYG